MQARELQASDPNSSGGEVVGGASSGQDLPVFTEAQTN